MLIYSLITPVYNGAAYIEETVLSVLDAIEKSGIKCEYLVIDDGSTDDTPQLLEKYKGQIEFISQENQGQARAINKGLKLAKGAYCTIVNADDPIIGAELLVLSRRILDEDHDLVGTYPDWQIIDSEGKIIETVFAKEFSLDEMVGNFNCLIGPGGVFRTSAAQEINGWDPEYRFVPDYDFWLRLLDFGDYQHIPKVLASWRTHQESISISSRSKEMANERIRVIESHLARNPGIEDKVQKSARANSIYRAAVLSYFDREIDGRHLFFQALKSRPSVILRKDIRVSIYLVLLPFSRFLSESLQELGIVQRVSRQIQRKLKR
jgi:glycosyltransferase involved in cell wall biosynthesis